MKHKHMTLPAALALAMLALHFSPAQAGDVEAFCEAAAVVSKAIGPDKVTFMAWCQPEAAKLAGTQRADEATNTPPGPETGATPERLRGDERLRVQGDRGKPLPPSKQTGPIISDPDGPYSPPDKKQYIPDR
jgi:hypothetical protein